jgi:SAM-dependent methyltransferase
MARLSRYLCQARLKQVIPYVQGDVLDLGCGPATILELLPSLPSVYVGVENCADYLTVLSQKYPQYTFLCKDLDTDTLDLNRRFDTILMTAVIEHIFNQKHFFMQALRHLAPGGKVLITTPTPFGDWIHRMGSRCGLFAAAAEDQHIVLYTRPRFEVLCRALGLRIETYRRFELGCNQRVILSVPPAADQTIRGRREIDPNGRNPMDLRGRRQPADPEPSLDPKNFLRLQLMV